ncbi:MAG: hypothetical protein SCJ94_10345 [Bacillota bacterium]|nr:hypothetical protein [Bacillota bacterium]
MADWQKEFQSKKIQASSLNKARIERYPLKVFDNHLLIYISGMQVLLDTGTPTSIGKVPLLLLGSTHIPQHSFMGLNIDALSKCLGHQIDYVLGSDLLKKFHLIVDYDKRIATFSDSPQNIPGRPFSVETMLNVPVITITIANQNARMFFDTGAKISYLKKSFTSGLPCTGIAEDFYPGIGQFQTNLSKAALTIMGENIELNCGNLPPLMEMSLVVANCAGIIGNDIFQYFNPISYSLSEELIYLEKRTTA